MFDVAARAQPQKLELDTRTERAEIAAAQANAAAFDVLYARYVTRVYRYLRLRLRTEQDALDLTQQVFVRALDALPRYRVSRAPFGAWLFRIARNALADHRRRHRASVPWDLLPESLHPRSTDEPEAASLHRESLAQLQEALAGLDPYRRELLALRFGGELRTREIAAVFGKPEATIKSDLRRTLQRLKGHYRAD